MLKAIVKVTLKEKILDPQGKAIEHSLHNLGFLSLGGVRTGKNIEISIDENDLSTVEELIKSACAKLLANQVTEDYEYQIFDDAGSTLSRFTSRHGVGSVSGHAG
ncbi:MAG: phosphoribosylformylglycinamidine synthase subunit PurS [Bacteroidetes bacterium]|nr:phosphoribosylformylglycinamidine synthase subunit PurS [Bacteroidota bacterium]